MRLGEEQGVNWKWGVDDLVSTFKVRGYEWDEAPAGNFSVKGKEEGDDDESDTVGANVTVGPTYLRGLSATAPTAVQAAEAAKMAERTGSMVLFGVDSGLVVQDDPSVSSKATTGSSGTASSSGGATASNDDNSQDDDEGALLGIFSTEALALIGAGAAAALLVAFHVWRARQQHRGEGGDGSGDEESPGKLKGRGADPGSPLFTTAPHVPFSFGVSPAAMASGEADDPLNETVRSVSSSDFVFPGGGSDRYSRKSKRKEAKVHPEPESDFAEPPEKGRPSRRRSSNGLASGGGAAAAARRMPGMRRRETAPVGLNFLFEAQKKQQPAGGPRRHTFNPSRKKGQWPG
eukprot:CAMPEP_0115437790 /NCGR_PEP_ID=MMETSP0271-20121206/34919_1 /TAXON_ID=71861 /ORGANISM="Scrippsiella trochoidea, Strain CCMP3099" /LENGTH=346 /DNA_ID=CAMNT_0002863415 /DNA_START=34 /DNA_END=1071 /DNA_ORIENTATION=-